MRTFEQEKDLFFVDSSTYKLLAEHLKTTVVCPKDEFKGHILYKNFHVSNCHRTWRIQDYDYVIVARPGWYESLSDDLQQLIFQEQRRTGSRLVLGNLLITQKFWRSLTSTTQQKLIHLYDEKIEEIDISGLPERFQQLHHVFPEEHGGNCFAAALYGVADEPSLLDEWVHSQSFLDMLERNHFKRFDRATKDSVLVFEHDGVVVHACYVIDDEYCFNKSGQTFFNPWHIARIGKVVEDWHDCKVMFFCDPSKLDELVNLGIDDKVVA
ncbi:hypothetical protein [Macrococcus brunensis]|uniref:hypothetical protein n=1 Tax=Macrococcus brunensis TaxID=198483 RepID=UPI001EF0FCD7|nr:hypothetical protein [Macrococcus brunensis]ULG71596.1 hypothetical protein MGG12_09860 [Macrococcus brunensis]